MLTQSRTILHLNSDLAADDCQVFEVEHEEDPSADHRSIAVAIPDELWIEMGRPLTVTASVQPGDLLN